MIAKYPPAINGDLGKEQGIPESTSMMQNGSYPDEAMEVTESRVPGWAVNFGIAKWVEHEAG